MVYYSVIAQTIGLDGSNYKTEFHVRDAQQVFVKLRDMLEMDGATAQTLKRLEMKLIDLPDWALSEEVE